MAMNTYTASGNIKGGSDVTVYQVIVSGTAAASAVLRDGGASGTIVSPYVRSLANDTVSIEFPEGVRCDYVTLAGTAVNCMLRFS